MAEPANVWRTTLKSRLAVAAVGLFVWSAAIEARLVYLQVFRHADLAARAERQQLRTIAASGKRGEILDRRGHVLAYSVDADTIYAVPTEIAEPAQAAASLCRALADCSPADRQALADRIRRGRAFVYVRRQVTPDQARRVADLQLEGVGFMKENRRFYPNKELAAHLLGYVGLDNTGLAGIEATYDNLIKGHAGTVLIQTDAKRHAFSRVERPSTTGADLELTVDQYLQHIAERELEAGVRYAGADGGSAIVMDPNTGEILALANYPTFNPNTYRTFGDDDRRNRAIQDLYEPGSTFKIVTASAALEQKLLKPTDVVDTNPGIIRFGSRVIDEDKHHNYGVLSLTDVIVRSSNVGAIKIGLRIGAQGLGLYARRFGFGRPTSPDFPSESPGILWDASRQSESALASMSMGYQVGVTPLQMAAAVSSVANGGELLQPRVVRAVTRDGVRKPVPRRVLTRAIDRDTAADVTSIMEAVVERGTGQSTRIDGYTIAGKTGTAQKVVNGRYSNTDYNVSFVGFIPSRKPVFTIVVVIDSPHRVPPYGATVAAPVFRRIAAAALRQYGVPPSINPAPPLLTASHDEDEAHEQPTSTTGVTPSIVTVDGGAPGSGAVFPDLRGLSARDALRTLSRLGMTARLNGAGVVVRQVPEPGAPIDRNLVVHALAPAAARRDAMTIRELLVAMTKELAGAAPNVIPDDAALDAPCTGVAYHSRQVKSGSVFVALPGQKADGVSFVPQAVAAGAAAVVSEHPRGDAGVPWVTVPNARLTLALLAAEFFGHPSRQMKVVGITGTNGKTTTSYVMHAIFEAGGMRCGLMGTVTYRIGERETVATRTTPEAPDVQAFMRQMVDAGCGACVMEVSSHALAMHRVDGIRFAAGVFTNLTRDHLDFHLDMESYFAAKRRLFEILPADAPAIINVDDPRGASLTDVVSRPVTYAINREADVTPGPLDFGLDGLTFDVRMPQGVARVESKLVGRPNVYNILAAAGTTAALGVPIKAIEQGLQKLAGVPGRFELASTRGDDITVVVDYAHTDDALRNLLETARPLATRRLITVFGAGGDRDRTKRPLMGMVAARLSDVVVITSDNPRGEDPARIIEEVKRGAEPEMRQGNAEVLTIADRREAIQHAIDGASAGDVVLIAGKGHERYQEIGGRVTPFDDVAVAREALGARREKSRVG